MIVDLAGVTAYVFGRLERELSPLLTYHCLAHTRDDVLPAAMRLADEVGLDDHDRTLLATAVLFHDLGFVERRLGHEEVGVRFAREALGGYGYAASDIDAIAAIVMATRLPQSPASRLGELMADADLDLLGRPDFFEKNDALRRELAASGHPGHPMSDAAWYEQQLEFLERHAYFTKVAARLRDGGKTQNAAEMRRRLDALKASAMTPTTAVSISTSHERLRASELFAALDDALVAHLAAAVTERRVGEGEVLVQEGDDAASLFVVAAGTFEVLLGQGALHTVGPGAVVGEVALVMGGKRSATVRAVSEGVVLELTRERFEALALAHPALTEPFGAALGERMRRVKIARHLRDLFGALDPAALAEIERALTWVTLPSGKELFRQGDAADGAYIVALGRLRVAVKGAGGDERVIDEVAPGQWIGEMALLTHRERSATVYAIRDSELVWLPQAAFDDLVRRHPQAMLSTSRLLVTRLQRQMEGHAPRPGTTRTLAVVPLGPGVPLLDFATDLARSLSAFGKTQLLRADDVDRELGKKGIADAGPDDPARFRLIPWLLAQEEAHDFVVYATGDRATGWTDRAIHHADQILFVADAREAPRATEVERHVAASFAKGRAPKQSLVLLQPKGPPPRIGRPGCGFPNTAGWLEGRTLDAHYHVRRDTPSDVARFVRLLTGNAIGLVLGGGGSRGYAHVGVVRALEELGIPIDAVGGTSIGAVMAAAAGLGLSSREMLEVCAPILAGFLDPTLPIVSLMSGQRAIDGVADVAGTLGLEDLAIPTFCISTNLTRGEEVVHRRGGVALATRASGSVPGVFPPVPYNGDLLVDGGLSNNVPVDVMHGIVGPNVIAVDVMPEVDLLARGDLPPSLSGWKFAWHRVNPFVGPIGMPSIVSILIRSVTTASHSLRRAEAGATSAALYLRPAVSKWNVLDFKAAAPIAEEGYRGTLHEISSWWGSAKSAILAEKAPSS